MKKQEKSNIEKIIRVVATVSSETSSWFAFYEPQLPEKLKKDREQRK